MHPKSIPLSEEAQPSKVLALWFPTIMVLAAFGPYIGSMGLKLEHFMVYGVGACIFMTFPGSIKTVVWGPLKLLMLSWVGLIAIQCLGLAWRYLSGLGEIVPGRTFASMEHHLQPLILVACSTVMIRRLGVEGQNKALNLAIQLLIWALTINSAMILFAMATGAFGLFGVWLPPGGLEGDSVWRLSIEMGRFGGIFNQPFESGIAYSLGVISWVYNTRLEKLKILDYLKLLLLIFGGIISISKVFILIGLPLFLLALYWFRVSRRIIFNWRLFLVAGSAFLAVGYLTSFWSGLDFFLRLFRPSAGQDLIDLYTANRFGGSETQVKEYFTWVMNRSPILGIGFSPFQVIDNGFLSAFAGGGVLGLACFIAFLLLLIRHCFRCVGMLRKLATLFILLMLGATMGGPAFTINRAGTLFWTMLPWIFLMGNRTKGLGGATE